MPTSPLDAVSAYYSGTLQRFGAMPLGVDWPNRLNQELRLVQLLKVCDLSAPRSLNDVGCGYGALRTLCLCAAVALLVLALAGTFASYRSSAAYYGVTTQGTRGKLLAVVGSGMADPDESFYVKVLSGHHYAYYLSPEVESAWTESRLVGAGKATVARPFPNTSAPKDSWP